MIQRIQSVFLLVSIGFLLLFIVFPLAHLNLSNNTFVAFCSIGFKNGEMLYNKQNTPWLPFLCSIINILLSFSAIFLYKKRMLQIKICIVNLLLSLGTTIILIIQLHHFMVLNTVSSYQLTPFIAIPLVNVLLQYLAFRGIKKDDALVKSYDRLR